MKAALAIVGAYVAICSWAETFNTPLAFAESIKIGITATGASGPVYVAQDKGYFAAAGLQTELVFFDGPESIPVALVAGSIDVGAGPIGAALYTLGGQGVVRIIGGLNRYHPGFHAMAMMASKRAWDSGLKSIADLNGHSIAVTQMGTSPQYSLSRLSGTYHLDLETIRIVPLKSTSNIVAALAGNQIDASIIPILAATPLIQSNGAKRFDWLDDPVGLQNGVIEASTQTAEQRHDMLEKFLAAYRKGAREYHDAFTGPNEEPRVGPGAAEVMKIIDKYTGQKTTTTLGASYIDPEGKVDVQDILRQIAWFKSMKMVKADLDADQIIDRRYVIPLK